jgi:hypothetical protein
LRARWIRICSEKTSLGRLASRRLMTTTYS